MSTLTLFGLPLAPLYFAIAQVESDNGLTSANVYQLSKAYVHDVNYVAVRRYSFRDDDRYIRWKAEAMMCEYLAYYGEEYRHRTGNLPTYEVLARIHNGGPNGWRKPSTLKYWAKVKRELEKKGSVK